MIKVCYYFKGKIISSNNIDYKNEIVKFDQLKIDLNISNTTIKKPKIQETSTFKQDVFLHVFLR